MAINTNNSQGINEINITPFVDIVLVLLIVFMISTPALVSKGMKVKLPEVKSGQLLSHVTLKIMITRDEKYFIDRQQVALDGISGIVTTLRKKDPSGDAIISADAEVSHGIVMGVADRLKAAGISNIGFAAQVPKRGAK